jgi:hypothetical protein
MAGQVAQAGDGAAFCLRIEKLKFSGSKNRRFESDPLPDEGLLSNSQAPVP